MIKPCNNWVLITEIPLTQESPGGIAYPPNYQGYRQGKMDFKVLAAGPKCDPAITPGSLCVLDQYRIMSRQDAGAPGQFLVQDSAIAIVICSG